MPAGKRTTRKASPECQWLSYSYVSPTLILVPILIHIDLERMRLLPFED